MKRRTPVGTPEPVMNTFARALMILAASTSVSCSADFPAVDRLPANPSLPDPLVKLDGSRVANKQEWIADRRPELKQLFQYYMYGFAPAAPKNVRGAVQRTDPNCLGGKATKKEITITYGPEGTPPINLLLIVPNKRTGPVAAFLGIAFCGPAAVLNDPTLPLSTHWMYGNPGVVNDRETEAVRGAALNVWCPEKIVDRGYALAVFYNGDVAPDQNEFADGVHPHYFKPGQTAPGPHEWGKIAAWAWGMSRAMDYLVTDPEIDARRVIAVGHSRNGKTAILAAAMDDRFAAAIPLQAGCGGTAPSRGKIGEPVSRINTVFPHWFDAEFKNFNEAPERLPFDQNGLVALCAPRPVLFSNATEDTWANPAGQLDVLIAADPVYRLLGVEGLNLKQMKPDQPLINSRLGYFIRPGKHSMTPIDWDAFLDFADKNVAR
jgi:hypothetical protein